MVFVRVFFSLFLAVPPTTNRPRHQAHYADIGRSFRISYSNQRQQTASVTQGGKDFEC